MKKLSSIFTILMVCVLAVTFTSCQKDGVYKPKQKISKIYVQRDGHDKILTETWTWDKNLLSSITFEEDDYTVNFVYDGKQVSKMVSGNQTVFFTYDGKQITNMTAKDGDTEYCSYTFKHDGNLIVGIDARINNSYMKNARIIEAAFRMIEPQIAESQMAQIAYVAENQIKADYTYSDTYTYDHKNVITLKRHDSENKDYEYTYTYSDYLNPFYHMLSGSEGDVVGLGLSKNAVATYHYSDNVINTRVIDMEVTFPEVDGKLPLQETRVTKTTHTVGTLQNNYTSTDNYFYEYE